MNIYRTGVRLANRYEIVQGPTEKASLLGGMGIVYLCYDYEEQRPVALKTFQPQYLADRAARDRFLREGTTWVNLGHHPHIVHCYAVERLSHGTEMFLVLEQVAAAPNKSGASLHDWLRPGHPLPLESALLFALQIVRGLAQAVALVPGFVHRDLKPGNVLVGADTLPGWSVNRVRVTDFGLVATLGEGVTLPAQEGDETAPHPTQLTHGWLGTPLYMAPEQWRGESVTVATDVYALGLILYEMITGQGAVAARSLAGLEQAHLRGALNPLPDGVPKAVAHLIRTCLAREPEQRYGTWAAVERDLALAYREVTGGRELPALVSATALGRAERLALGWAHNRIGLSYQDIGKPDAAATCFEQVCKVGEVEGEPALLAAGLGNLGNVYNDLGDSRRAIDYLNQALAFTQEIRDRVGEARILGNLGNAYRRAGDPRRAISFLEQTMTITRELNDQVGQGTALSGLGNAHFKLGDARQAIDYHQKHLSIAQETKDRVAQGTALGNLASVYLKMGDVKQAIAYSKRHLEIAKNAGDRVGERNALGNLGSAYSNLGDARRSIDYLEKSLAIARETRDQVSEGEILGNLGITTLQSKDIHLAIGYFEKALTIARWARDREGEGTALRRLGHAYFQLGDAHRAIGYFEQHLTIAKKAGDYSSLADDLGNLALLQEHLEEPRKALTLATEAVNLYAHLGNKEYVQRTQQLIARLQSRLIRAKQFGN